MIFDALEKSSKVNTIGKLHTNCAKMSTLNKNSILIVHSTLIKLITVVKEGFSAVLQYPNFARAPLGLTER